MPSSGGAERSLPWLVILYAAASLVHFAHNAQFLTEYPNLPPSWTRADVYGAWCGLTLLGALGLGLYRLRYTRSALAILALYASAGFAGFLHYARAPLSQHSLAMNLTIWLEAAAAALLLLGLVRAAARRRR